MLDLKEYYEQNKWPCMSMFRKLSQRGMYQYHRPLSFAPTIEDSSPTETPLGTLRSESSGERRRDLKGIGLQEQITFMDRTAEQTWEVNGKASTYICRILYMRLYNMSYIMSYMILYAYIKRNGEKTNFHRERAESTKAGP